MPSPTWVLFLFAMAACEVAEDSAPADSALVSERCAFSFAILTDTHLGEGEQDHGEPGWDDGGGDGGDSADTLAGAVQQVNAQADELAFVVVLGDLSDSGERSELSAARAVLDQLEVPWLPLLGNHDVWPYAWDQEAQLWDEADAPCGDVFFDEIFDDAFVQAAQGLPSLVRAEPVWNPEAKTQSQFVNFAFDHCGTRIVALDTNTRIHASPEYPGVGPEAALHDFDGGTWPWFLADLDDGPGESAESVVVLSHHPVMGAGYYTFDEVAFAQIEADLAARGGADRIRAFFAGHIHMDAELEGPLGLPVVLTAATKDGTPPRVIHVTEEGEVEW